MISLFCIIGGTGLDMGCNKAYECKGEQRGFAEKSEEGVDRVKKEIWRFGEERMNLLLC